MKTRDCYLLAIGIDKYKYPDWPQLDNAVSDTKAVIEVLTTRYSFQLLQAPLYNEQATRVNILEMLTNAIAAIGPEDNLVIYFGGHGFMHPLTYKGFWVPHEARKNVADLISNSDVKDFLEHMEAKHVFLVADACFSGTFLTRTRGGGFDHSYESLDHRNSRWMLASGSEENVSDGTRGGSSPFARYLLRFLQQNTNHFCSVQEIIRYVTVMTTHNSKQHPRGARIEHTGDTGGQMVLALANGFEETNNLKTNGDPRTLSLVREMRSVYGEQSKLSAGKEIFLVDSIVDSKDLQIWECFRFDDAGKKALQFQGDDAIIAPGSKNQTSLRLYARFATWEGLIRYWEENNGLYEGRQVAILPAIEEIEKVESSDHALFQQGIIRDMLDANQDQMRCLHCNNMITDNNSFLVEIDEIDLQQNAGNIHAACRRPADRVLGKSMFKDPKPSNLVSFDADNWVTLVKRGQAFLLPAKKIAEKKAVAVIAWNREHNFNAGEYCIKTVYTDGSSSYVKLGRQIHRFPADGIDEEVSEYNQDIIDAREKGNPMGATKIFGRFGRVSELKKDLITGETIKEVDHYEKARYSRQLNAESDLFDNDYAPLGLLVVPGSQEYIKFDNFIPLITNPAEFDKMHENWNNSGFKIGQCALKIIENDKDVDLHLMAFFEDGMQPVLDPVFGAGRKLVKGTLIKDIEEFKQAANTTKGRINLHGKWKAGDRVKIVFPEVETDNHATGILLTDEFINESGEPYIIFRPIEDGIVREDLQFMMPVRLLVKDE